MSKCEYFDCALEAKWTVVEFYVDDDDAAVLNVCDTHRPGGYDPRSLWNERRPHGFKRIGDSDPNLTWINGVKR